jgi:peptidoglycan/LPS O-acetylase OafA/YrhL
LGGHVVPIVVTMLFVGLLVAVASVSYHFIEKPGQEWFARAARWLRGSDPSRLVRVNIAQSR